MKLLLAAALFAPLATAVSNAYTFCPNIAFFVATPDEIIKIQSVDPLQAFRTFRAAVIRCDARAASGEGCTALETWQYKPDGTFVERFYGGFPTFPPGPPGLGLGSQVATGYTLTSALSFLGFSFYGLAIRDSSKAAYLAQPPGRSFPANCRTCYSAPDGSCCSTLNADSCDAAGANPTCSSGFVLYQGQCISDCPSSTYNKGGVCTDCTIIDPQAATCSSTVALSCTSTHNLYNGTCVAQCPSSTFPSNDVCKSCTLIDPHALTCSATATLTCAAPYTLNKEGTCVCKSGRYNPASKDCPAGNKEHGEGDERPEYQGKHDDDSSIADDRNEREQHDHDRGDREQDAEEDDDKNGCEGDDC